MLNQFVIVGRLSKEVKDNILTIAVPRNYKNENGEYDTDYIECRINGKIAENTIEYCHKGDIVGVKGAIHSEEKSGVYNTYIQVEKITFLSSTNKEETEEEE